MDTSVVAGQESVATDTLGRRIAPRHYRTASEKLRVVRESLQPSRSVSEVARVHEVNANQVFLWRRQHANGVLSGRKPRESKRKALKLLPVQISAEPVPSTEVHAVGHVEIVFGDGLRVRCVGQVEQQALEQVLSALRR